MIFDSKSFPPSKASFGHDEKGISESIVEDVPIKSLAHVKSNNYLTNCMIAMSAQASGGKFGIIFDPTTGYLLESCNLCVFCVRENKLLTPHFNSNIIKSCTGTRILELSNKLVDDKTVQSASHENITRDELLSSDEVFLAAGDTHLYPVTSINGKTIGKGIAGPVFRSVENVIEYDLNNPSDEQHDKIPY